MLFFSASVRLKTECKNTFSFANGKMFFHKMLQNGVFRPSFPFTFARKRHIFVAHQAFEGQ